MDILSNPPAFPRPASLGNNYATGEEDVVVDPQKGMTLLDYFAASSIYTAWRDLARLEDKSIGTELDNGVKLSAGIDVFTQSRHIANLAYEIASALLDERKQRTS